MTIHQYLNPQTHDASLNACAQALKQLAPEMSRRQFLRTLGVPDCMTANTRYWYESYNILPWSSRTETERQAALAIANHVLEQS